MGAFAPASVQRAARHADGINVHDIGGDVEVAKALFGMMTDAWKEYGRAGKPRLLAGFFFALGPDSDRHLDTYFHDYYEYAPDMVKQFIASVDATSPAAIKEKFKQYEDIGCDELVITPVVGTLDQEERLAELLP